MFQKLEHKIAAGFIVIASALGIQIHRPATMEDHTNKVTVQKIVQPAIIQNFSSPTNAYPQMNLGPVTNQDGSAVTAAQMAMAVKSVQQDNAFMQTQEFKDDILNGQFTETNGLTNSQIWDLICSKPITVGIQFFYGTRTQNYVWKTMGYDQGDGIVYANTFYIDTPELLGSLNLHEAEGHGQGFHHYQVMATSVPYNLNDFFDSYYKQ